MASSEISTQSQVSPVSSPIRKEAEKERKYTLDYYNNNKDSGLQGINDILYYQTLGKPTIKFEFDTNDELKKFLTENKENLIN